MKRIVFLILTVLLLLPFSAMAAENAPFIKDDAQLLTDAEETALQIELAEISSQYGAQVSVVTLAYTDDWDMDACIERLYDQNGYGYGADKDGVLLLICMAPREYRILSNGFAARAISLEDIDAIGDEIVSDLSAGDYAAAISAYGAECAYYLNGHLNGFPFQFGKTLLICLLVGLAVGLIVALILKGQLKSVRGQSRANNYVRSGSMALTQCGDYFMYRNVTRTPRQTNSSSSSSGSSRNVGGGRF